MTAAPHVDGDDWVRVEALRRGAAHRAERGLPPTITDPVVIAAAVKAAKAAEAATAKSSSLPSASAAVVPPTVAAGEGDLGATASARSNATKPRAATQGSVNDTRGRGRSKPAAHAGRTEQ